MTRRRQWLQVAFLLAAVVVVIAAMVACTSPASIASIPPTPSSSTSSATAPTAAGTTSAPTVAAGPGTTAPVAAPPAAVGHNVTPQRGEGLIALTTRVCGTSRSWTGQAAANHVAGPAYVLYLGRGYDIDCSRVPVAAPVVARQAPQAATSAEWINPLPGTCRPRSGGGQYGAPRDDNHDGITDRYHQGIDLGGIEGLPVWTRVNAAHGGTVVFAGDTHSGAGYQVQIQGGGWLVKYNHLREIDVRAGWAVNAGDLIGKMGGRPGDPGAGNATGPHLHIEVINANGSHVNPSDILPVRC